MCAEQRVAPASTLQATSDYEPTATYWIGVAALECRRWALSGMTAAGPIADWPLWGAKRRKPPFAVRWPRQLLPLKKVAIAAATMPAHELTSYVRS